MSAPNLRAIRDWVNQSIESLNKTLGKNINTVDEKLQDVKSSVTLNGGQVYLDYKNGAYGINTDPKRGADTFTPFKSGSSEGGGTVSGTYQVKTLKIGADLVQIDLKSLTSKYKSIDINKGIFIVISEISVKTGKNVTGTAIIFEQKTYNKNTGLLTLKVRSSLSSLCEFFCSIYFES